MAKRAIVAIFTLWVVATLTFIIFVAYPGDPAAYILDPMMTREQQEMISAHYGLHDPLPVQYLRYLRNMFTFGLVPPYFGVSFYSHRFVAEELSWRLSLTVGLLGSTLIGVILIGVPAGILAASRRGGKGDVAVIGTGLFTWGVPTFFIQLMALLLFNHYLNAQLGIKIFPAGKAHSIPAPTDPVMYMLDFAWHAALPVLTLVVAGFGGWALYTRNMLVDALTQDYILTARAKGVSERTILYKHAFRSILPPISTMVTLSIPGIVTGAIITETIFGWPGIGKWYVNALDPAISDYPVVQAVLFIFATLVIICNFLADVLYGILDPRIRVGMRR